MLNKIKKNLKGLSIIEVTIALGVITIGMVGLLSLIVQNTRVYYTNKNRFTASMLAQEAVELVRNKRDSNWIAGSAWNNGINIPIYRIDIDGNISAVSSITDVNAKLLKDGTDNSYQYSSGTASQFFRIIEKTDIDVNSDLTVDGYKIISTVQWSERGNTHDVSVETYLFDWK